MGRKKRRTYWAEVFIVFKPIQTLTLWASSRQIFWIFLYPSKMLNLVKQLLQGEGKKPCSVSGCTDTYSVRHKYPSYLSEENLFLEWSWRIGRFDYIVNPMLARYATVCGCHFNTRSKRQDSLKKYAKPTLNLPGIGKDPDLLLPPVKRRPRCYDENAGANLPFVLTVFIMCNCISIIHLSLFYEYPTVRIVVPYKTTTKYIKRGNYCKSLQGNLNNFYICWSRH